MLPHNLKGARLPALERNLLKYRALEMMVVLFQVEHLREFVLDSIRATDRFRRPRNPRIPPDAKKVYEKAWAILVADGILTQAESDEIQGLVDYRNIIAHEIQWLVCDVGDTRFARDYAGWRGVKYDYKAAAKLKHYRDKIEGGFTAKGYIMSLSLDSVAFAAAEKTYEQEVQRLQRKITHQLDVRNEEIRMLKAELRKHDSALPFEAHPSHPLNKTANGRLTKRGVDTCYRLFAENTSTLAVAHLMRISYRAAVKRRRAWEKVRG
jgi:hypothetical protein